MSEIPAILTALASLITAIAVLTATLLNARRIKEVHAEVKTANSLSMAQLADATEDRRISHIKPKDRTKEEKSHVKAMK